MEINVPTYLNGFVKDLKEESLTQMTICSSSKNELLEVWYYGDIFNVAGEDQPYIVDKDDSPCRIVARDTSTGEDILIFDGAKHGYNNMFCDEYIKEQIENRPLKQYELPASKLILELGYSIDYEDEKDDYEFDENDNVVLVDGSKMDWESVKRNGFDYLGVYFINAKGEPIQFADFELA